MENKSNLFNIFFGILLSCAILVAGAFFIPWQKINWGKLELLPGETITVTGEAKSQQKTQVASFSAGVTALKDNKQEAIDEVNQKVKAIIEAVKEFGIKPEDIKTQNLNVYQNEETYYEEGRQKTRLGQWRVNNTIEVKLRDVDRTSALANLLTKSGANNVYGPNFSLDETKSAENSLLEDAMKNAQAKAEIIAKTAGKKVGKVVSISEGYQPVSVFRYEGIGAGGGGAPLEPGSQTVQKTITVTFELK